MSRLPMIVFVSALLLGGCRSTIHHATMDPEVLDFGTIALDDESVLELTFGNLEEDPVYLYFLVPDTFGADMVPPGDDQDSPFFDFEQTLEIPGGEDLVMDVHYACQAVDRGYFRWEVTILSSLEDLGYWEATREVGTLVLQGTCGD